MSLITTTGAVTMTSREIAELTGKQHKHVIRDIREMLDALEKDGPVLGHVREDKDSRGYTENFHLDRELTETLVTGYSIPLRHKVIRRLHELEEQVAQPAIPQTLPEALRLAADLAEECQQLAAERDHAVATKAEIGSRREATAMASASAAVREARRLPLSSFIRSQEISSSSFRKFFKLFQKVLPCGFDRYLPFLKAISPLYCKSNQVFVFAVFEVYGVC
ncbi:Rha family transcriptional regulator [Pseudomonas aeruginosa]